MTTRAATTPGGRSTWSRLWSGFTVLATLVLAFITCVELINTLFYDPWSDERFLFTFAESLASVSISHLTILMFGTLALLLMMGLPMAFVVGGLGVVFIYLVGGPTMINIIPVRIFPLMANPDLAAIPLFIFMASMLERAGLIEEMFDVVYKWMGGLRGGLAAATIVASTILAGHGRGDRRRGGDDGHHRPAGDAAAQLRPQDCPRLHHGRRHPRHPHPAVHPGDPLRRGGAAVCRPALPGLGGSGSDAVQHVHRLHPPALVDQPDAGTVTAQGRARQPDRKAAPAAQPDRADLSGLSRPGPALRRHRHAGRGGGHRLLRRHDRRRHAQTLQPAGAARRVHHHGSGVGHGAVDHVRGVDLRRLLHPAGRPRIHHRRHPRHRPETLTAFCCS